MAVAYSQNGVIVKEFDKQIKYASFIDNVKTNNVLTNVFYIQDNILTKTQETGGGLFFQSTLPFATATEYEFKFTINMSSSSGIYASLFGDQYYYYRGPTLWLDKNLPRTDGETGGFLFGVPNGTDDWASNAVASFPPHLYNTWYSLIAKFNNVSKILEIECFEDGNKVDGRTRAVVPLDYSRMNKHVMFDAGTNSYHDHYFIGQMDLSNSYIKIDGVRYF